MNSTITIDKKTFNYSEYLQYTEDILEGRVDDPVYQNETKFEATKLNLHRMKRIYKHLRLDEMLLTKIHSQSEKLIFTVLTEPWCGDAAQSIPVLAKLEDETEGKVSLKLILRDENLELMDRHLTNGSRSIPKVLVSTEKKPEKNLITWGPRPTFLQDFVQNAIAEGLDQDIRNKNVQKMYAKDKQMSIQTELLRNLP